MYVTYSLSIMLDTPTIVAIVAVCGSIATVIISLRRERSDIDKKNIDSLLTRVSLVENEKDEVKRRLGVCEEKHAKNLEERGKLQGQLDTALAILKDRNPETETFMKYLTGVAKQSQDFMEGSNRRDEKILNALTQIGDFMKSINDHIGKPSATTVNVTTPQQPVVS